jgi:hypothetical protein
MLPEMPKKLRKSRTSSFQIKYFVLEQSKGRSRVQQKSLEDIVEHQNQIGKKKTLLISRG